MRLFSIKFGSQQLAVSNHLKTALLKKYNLLGAIIISFMIQGCGPYSFTGASIPPEVKTFSVQNFPNNASLINPELSQIFTEKLKDQFLQTTRLKLADQNGDLEFSGSITRYNVSPTAVESNDRASRTRLKISIKVDYENRYNKDQNFTKTFSNYEDFESDQNLNQVEDKLVEDITDQLVQDIFNATVNNW